ncbi:LexA family transcriptional regulator [Rhodocaloribacter litoris]|uniref:LexA family protein n=1 Tax=Rhodocaloribacter litoris TaxID=2558931 RepID=UPI00142430E8|nr:S24 family peptidase [Rhodocaloribacter litoris]QXD17087.1 LexA family transcriptional regulator [Rhodocaloribacter litoris]
MKARLTERQNETFEFIRAYMRRHRKPPTLQEIGTALGVRSVNAVSKLVRALEQKGYLEREAHAARGLRLVDMDEDPFRLDDPAPSLLVVSRTASHAPERLRERPSGFLTVDPYFLRGVREPEHCLIARAGDDGMNGDGIHKGDFLIVEEMRWKDLRNGEVAAVLIEEALHARRFFFANGRLHLRPADRNYTEETFAPDDPRCHVIGRVIGVMRRL